MLILIKINMPVRRTPLIFSLSSGREVHVFWQVR